MQNTVTLSLEAYKELADFKRTMENGGMVAISFGHRFGPSSIIHYIEKPTTETLTRLLTEANSEINQLKEDIVELEKEKHKDKPEQHWEATVQCTLDKPWWKIWN